MMSKTHITMGVAVTMAVMHPNSVDGCLAAVAGGAVGGVLADIDTLKDDSPEKDALVGQLIGLGITVIVFVVDFFLKGGLCSSVVNQSTIQLHKLRRPAL